MSMMRRLLPAALALTLVACGPNPQAPVQIMSLVISPQGILEPKQVTLDTIEDVLALRGTVAHLTGGARIVVDENDPLLQTNGGNLTNEQLAQVFLKSRGIEPRGSYVEKNGVLWPADFHTWNMVSTYYNMEKSFTYFQSVGMLAEEMVGAHVYYDPNFILAQQSVDPLQDNALFFSPVQAFMVLPFKTLQSVPLPMNFGVIAHEFGHRVFNIRVYGGESIPTIQVRFAGGSGSVLNLLKSMDEGLADWNAVGATCLQPSGCNTRFLSASLSALETDARDMSKPDKCMTTALRSALTGPNEDFVGLGTEYQVGTILASALYHGGNKSGQIAVVRRAVIASYSDPSTVTPGFRQLFNSNLNNEGAVNLAAVLNIIASHIGDPTLQKDLCDSFIDRLGVTRAQMPACPASANGGNPRACPALPAEN